MDVTLTPLQRIVSARAGDNLLEVLRAHQVPISYSCMSGRCGTCRCRVLSGNVVATGGTEINAPSAPGQTVLACQTTLVEDCAIELPEVDEIVVHPARIIKSKVVAIEDMTHDIKRIRLELAKPLAFSPGQYATLQFTPRHVRPYSMAVADAGQALEFHVRLVPGGRVTSYVAAELKVGDDVRVSGPLGTAYLRRKNTDPVICVAGGTGLAPILSILRGMAEAGMANPVHVYFGVRSPADVYGTHWLDALRERLPNLHTHVVVATSSADARYRSGVVTDAVASDWADLRGWRAYLAGAPVMVDAASLLLRQRGVPAEHVYADAFYAVGV
ncbi:MULTISPECIES: 2Fe-2S iron-sulfur cluster-binding protein [Ralstonia solanacearum species complex]|uniref:2Fe-2S iron-sulfur cluster binding domain-containing protein n=2 Tax=Ralstonia solanacearum species complex TaxID=3116862 RepID=A0A0S4WTB0_RALSL|nr:MULTISPECIES: 2Fe-2S iron-sulfur cluster-binding protein [Ralstonia]ANH33633.1 naphthalene 1,2-dioxygenase [Ralstonia solanacearum]APF87548.1 naphthalene 1,2-dioxygenase [Ralstonia solanacearum FJAT-1458]ARS55689.1 naphthalene 1,2-dioxygenase [Ralstonia solanacearum FJAT-91]ESS48798.1 ferredoxin oxidoreductase oxidoreductase [Ralstonia solanacearum SD54]AGH83581.1 Ferredoxin reductase [Ralstonia pseudosolanacearum FQY_4]